MSRQTKYNAKKLQTVLKNTETTSPNTGGAMDDNITGIARKSPVFSFELLNENNDETTSNEEAVSQMLKMQNTILSQMNELIPSIKCSFQKLEKRMDEKITVTKKEILEEAKEEAVKICLKNLTVKERNRNCLFVSNLENKNEIGIQQCWDVANGQPVEIRIFWITSKNKEFVGCKIEEHAWTTIQNRSYIKSSKLCCFE